mmetsp:Transcript_4626/g.14878  ORF Transcript_4626/g.14878 Transcript_4626/m.14878 type:complete len:324 (-) Transcript_4626:123-1094(-)
MDGISKAAMGMPNMREKYKEPQHFLSYKDPTLPPEEQLEVDVAQLKAAKDSEIMKPIRIRFMEEGPDRTIDDGTKFPKNCQVEGFSAQQTILELRQAIADQENMAVEDVNLFCKTTHFDDHMLVAQLYVDWMGFGLEDWPPRFISKPRVRGFELNVEVPAMRDTSVWENGRMQAYHDRTMVFDVEPAMKVEELKALVTAKINIPAKRQILTAFLRRSLKSCGEYVELDDNAKTLSDYEIDKYCVCIKFEKNMVDENGDYVFDDAYWDAEGYHAQPVDTWIPQDSLADRSRPDAQKVDPGQPLSIVSDRRQKEAQDRFEADQGR